MRGQSANLLLRGHRSILPFIWIVKKSQFYCLPFTIQIVFYFAYKREVPFRLEAKQNFQSFKFPIVSKLPPEGPKLVTLFQIQLKSLYLLLPLVSVLKYYWIIVKIPTVIILSFLTLSIYNYCALLLPLYDIYIYIYIYQAYLKYWHLIFLANTIDRKSVV